MDLREKIERTLEAVIHIDEAILSDDDGMIGYIVSPDFRGRDSYARQELIYDALRSSSSVLDPEDLSRVVAVVAFTPEEYAVHGPEMHRSL